MLKVAMIGLGSRGGVYLSKLLKRKDVVITAICEKRESILNSVKKRLALNDNQTFLDEEAFFSAGKLGDCLIIATQDRDHYRHAMRAMKLGYNLLMEKPMSPILSECEEMNSYAKENNIKVVVCHVLRYSPYYDKMKKIIDSGLIGNIVSINDVESIGYWHFSHSYVRGNWRNESQSAPSLLAKCCHDLDLMYYLTGKKCKRISSVGSRKLFSEKTAPKGSAKRCLDGCEIKKSCPFDVEKIYYKLTRHSLPKMIIHYKLITGDSRFSMKRLKESLKNASPFGRCVYHCDNDVVENQMVTMQLEDNINCNLTMTAFTKKCFRRFHICGTKGEIIGNDNYTKFKVNVFGKRSFTVRMLGFAIGHVGGDKHIINDFVEYLTNGKKNYRLSLIEDTMESHKMAFKAEESRKQDI